jgi:enamine deaminase RidA (YjgF/YER057c/UK114 family)
MKELIVGVFAHVTCLHIPDFERGKTLATAVLRGSQPAVISSPYGKWLNAYLPLGISWKDVPDLPTATHIEINCYDSEGLDLRLYSADRLAFFFESGCGEDSDEEDRLMEIAAQLWLEENPVPPESEAAAHPSNFWSLDPKARQPWLDKAGKTREFRDFVNQSREEMGVPDCEPLRPFLPPGRELGELENLLRATLKRLHGPPEDPAETAALSKWMGGRTHSDKAEDYVRAIADFLGLKGAEWSLPSIESRLAAQLNRGIIPINALEETSTLDPNAPLPGGPEARLRELNITLPEAPKPVAIYIPAIRTGNLVLTSGQLPTIEGIMMRTGKVGEGGIAPEEAQKDARQSCLNALAAIRAVIGSLDKIQRVVRVVVYVQSMDNFTNQPIVANGASKLLEDIFGEKGRHIRSALGVNVLPLNAPVEVELIVEVKD